MTIQAIVDAIAAENQRPGFKLNAPACADDIARFEATVGFALPDEFREFYAICNGFECVEDLFTLIPLDTILANGDHGKHWFHFAEYMIYCDMWTLRNRNGLCEIINKSDREIVLSTSLRTFLIRFLAGNVFEAGGLYDWHEVSK